MKQTKPNFNKEAVDHMVTKEVGPAITLQFLPAPNLQYRIDNNGTLEITYFGHFEEYEDTILEEDFETHCLGIGMTLDQVEDIQELVKEQVRKHQIMQMLMEYMK